MTNKKWILKHINYRKPTQKDIGKYAMHIELWQEFKGVDLNCVVKKILEGGAYQIFNGKELVTATKVKIPSIEIEVVE